MPTPIVSITNVTNYKVSDEAEFDQTIVSFTFDIRTVEMLARCNGTDQLTGLLVDQRDKYVATQSSKTVEEMASETVIDVSSFPANTEFTATIDFTELYGEGENRINIYGLSEESPRYWTPYDQA